MIHTYGGFFQFVKYPFQNGSAQPFRSTFSSYRKHKYEQQVDGTYLISRKFRALIHRYREDCDISVRNQDRIRQ